MTNEHTELRLRRRIEKLETALRQIAAWQLPQATMQDWYYVNLGVEKVPRQVPCSYGIAYGSQGEQAYIQSLATAALTPDDN